MPQHLIPIGTRQQLEMSNFTNELTIKSRLLGKVGIVRAEVLGDERKMRSPRNLHLLMNIVRNLVDLGGFSVASFDGRMTVHKQAVGKTLSTHSNFLRTIKHVSQ